MMLVTAVRCFHAVDAGCVTDILQENLIRTSVNSLNRKGKGKVRPRTGHEGPEGE